MQKVNKNWSIMLGVLNIIQNDLYLTPLTKTLRAVLEYNNIEPCILPPLNKTSKLFMK